MLVEFIESCFLRLFVCCSRPLSEPRLVLALAGRSVPSECEKPYRELFDGA